MFDLDVGKMLLVAVVALVVVGPKELPQVLRALGKALGRLRSLQGSAQKLAADFMAEADLAGIGNEMKGLDKGLWTSIAANPATAMRGSLPALSGATAITTPAKVESLRYTSPEMELDLSPPPETPPDMASAHRARSDTPDALVDAGLSRPVQSTDIAASRSSPETIGTGARTL